ncbi:unnamed protein product [Caenorhabditis brenneri]
MLPQIRLRWKEYFDWLGNLGNRDIKPYSKSYYSKLYIEVKKLKLHKTCFIQSSNEVITAMMLDFKISFVKQAKMLFMLSIPITYFDQLEGIKNSAKVIEFDEKRRITKYESNNGRVKFEGAHDHKTKRNEFVYIDDDEEKDQEVIPKKKKRSEPKRREVVVTSQESDDEEAVPSKNKRRSQQGSDGDVSNADDSDKDIHNGPRRVLSENQAKEDENATEAKDSDNFDIDPSGDQEDVEEEDSDEEGELAANRQPQHEHREISYVDLKQSNKERVDERVEMEVEEGSDDEELNIDTSSMASMLSFVMGDDDDDATKVPSIRQVSDVGIAPTTSGNLVRAPPTKKKLEKNLVAPTPTNQVFSSNEALTTEAEMTPTTSRSPVGVLQLKRNSEEDLVAQTSTSQVCLSNEPSTSSASFATVEVFQIKKTSAEAPFAPTPAKRKCFGSIQNGNNLSQNSQPDQQSLSSSSTPSSSKIGPIVSLPVDDSSSPEAVPVQSVQCSPRRSMRTNVVPKKSDNKENISATPDSEPGPSSSRPQTQQQSPEPQMVDEPVEVQPSANRTAIGATLLGGEEGSRWFYFPRSHILPTGLKRSPFNGELPKDVRRKCEYSKIMRKLKVQKDVNFPTSTREGKLIESVLGKEEEKQIKARYPGDPSKNDPEGLAVMEKFLGDRPDQEYMDMNDKEEELWSAEKFEEHLDGDEERKRAFCRVIEQKYLFAVWRQFESRVPLEFALQNLQKNDYNISLALGSIDKYLKKLPQRMIEPSAAQVQYLATEFKENGEHVDLCWIQDNVMRNFHMTEIHGFYYKFRKFFEFREDGNGVDLRVACNCNQKMCRPLIFEPRYGCANCTNKLRKHKLSADKLCLLCSTQKEVARRLSPAEKPSFHSDDLDKIKKWDKEAPGMSRTEFDKWIQDQKNERYRKLQLTQEEVLMLDFEKLTVSNLAEQVTAQLQPYVLPHFSRCRCRERLPVANPPPAIPDL